MKKIGNFLYNYSEDGTTITVAYQALFSNWTGEMLVLKQLEGVLTHTGQYSDVVYENNVYVGLVYHNTILSEEQLVEVLSAKR